MRESKNYVLFLGETGAKTSQQPCLSLVQFQIETNQNPTNSDSPDKNDNQSTGSLIVSAYQRSSDASLGLPSDSFCDYKDREKIFVL